MVGQVTRYGFGGEVALPYEQAVSRTREALAKEGFGVLTEIDVAATLKQKLGVDFPPYVILGACNPPLAHRALAAEPEIGLLLPCNVTVRAADDPARSIVAAMDPEAALQMAATAAVAPVAAEVAARLRRVLASVAGETGAVAPAIATAPECAGDGSPALEECAP
jgi:uncharacterized protein (DUF302 family)